MGNFKPVKPAELCDVSVDVTQIIGSKATVILRRSAHVHRSVIVKILTEKLHIPRACW